MKTRLVLLVCCALLTPIFSYAQLQRGTWLLDGSANWQTELKKGVNNAVFSVYPLAGYAFSERWLAGAQAGGQFTHSKNNTTAYEGSSLIFSPFVRYYITKPNPHFNYFLQVRAGVNYTRSSFTQDFFGESDFSRRDYDLTTTLGFNYFITPSQALEGRLGYIVILSDAKPIHSLGFTLEQRCFLPNEKPTQPINDVFSPGDFLLHFDVTGTWHDIAGYNEYFLEFNPTIGYFIHPRWAVGTGLLMGFANQNQILELSPFARYYFGAQGTRFQPFATVSTSTRFQFADETSEPSFFNLDVNGGIGLDFFITSNVALEGLLQYNHYQIEDAISNRQFLNFSLGFQFFIKN
ncbi:MAG: hypothetical protein ACK4TA_22230 [Saprospiraceae bacterium]